MSHRWNYEMGGHLISILVPAKGELGEMTEYAQYWNHPRVLSIRRAKIAELLCRRRKEGRRVQRFVA